ncbi:MAG: winged helix-turn-helix domain-containing protein [Candidatus Thorarchaeota archaeon]
MKRVLWWLIAGTKGGINRARILQALRDRPYNANQLAEILNLDYKTVRHHLDILIEHQLIVAQGDGYGRMYFLSTEFEQSYNEFLEIWERIWQTGKSE